MATRWRQGLFIAATTMFVALAAMQWLRTFITTSHAAVGSERPRRLQVDPLLTAHRRADELLPPEGRVSYLTDRDFQSATGSLARFYRAQWRLAPRVLDRRVVHGWAIADYESQAAYRQLLAGEMWVEVASLEDGMKVLRHTKGTDDQ